MSDDKKPKRAKYEALAYGTKVRIIETSSGLILRTLDSRSEATAFLLELDPPKEKK